MSERENSPHSQPVPSPNPHPLNESKPKKRVMQRTVPETPVSLLQELRRKAEEKEQEEQQPD